jgi:hypothetical protein
MYTKCVMEILPRHILAVLEARWAFDAVRHLNRAAPQRQDGVVERVPRYIGYMVGFKESVKIMGEFGPVEEREDATTQL